MIYLITELLLLFFSLPTLIVFIKYGTVRNFRNSETARIRILIASNLFLVVLCFYGKER